MGETFTRPVSVDANIKTFGDEDTNVPFFTGPIFELKPDRPMARRRTFSVHDGHKEFKARKKPRVTWGDGGEMRNSRDSRDQSPSLECDTPIHCSTISTEMFRGLSDGSIAAQWADTSVNRRNLFNSIEIRERRSIITVEPTDKSGDRSDKKIPTASKERFRNKFDSNGDRITPLRSRRRSNRIFTYFTTDDPREIRTSKATAIGEKPIGKATTIFEKVERIPNVPKCSESSKKSEDKRFYSAPSSKRLKSKSTLKRSGSFKNSCRSQSKTSDAKSTKRTILSVNKPSNDKADDWTTPRVFMAIQDRTVQRAWRTREPINEAVEISSDFDICTTSSHRICLMSCPDVKPIIADESTDDERSWKTVDITPLTQHRLSKKGVRRPGRHIIEKSQPLLVLKSLEKKRNDIRHKLLQEQSRSVEVKAKETANLNAEHKIIGSLSEPESREVLLIAKGVEFDDVAASSFSELKDDNESSTGFQIQPIEPEHDNYTYTSPSDNSSGLKSNLNGLGDGGTNQNKNSDTSVKFHDEPQNQKNVAASYRSALNTSIVFSKSSTEEPSSGVDQLDATRRTVGQTEQIIEPTRPMTMMQGSDKDFNASSAIELIGSRSEPNGKKTSPASPPGKRRVKRSPDPKEKPK